MDSNGDGAWDQRTRTDYLNDPHNHTGYSQILRETYLDAATGVVQKRIDYTIGLDEIAQTITTYDAQGNVVSRETLIFGHDGHGSVRVLFDLAGAIAQLYVYEAYGQLAAIYNAAGQFLSANPADALTGVLHDGEPFDNRIGWGYRRARWVDPRTGRFNGFDPFFGDLWEPQSFHKYLFTHADPINGIDPTGNSALKSTLAGIVTGFLLGTAVIIGQHSKQHAEGVVHDPAWWEYFIPGWAEGRLFGHAIAHRDFGAALYALGLLAVNITVAGVTASYFERFGAGLHRLRRIGSTYGTGTGTRAIPQQAIVKELAGPVVHQTANFRDCTLKSLENMFELLKLHLNTGSRKYKSLLSKINNPDVRIHFTDALDLIYDAARKEGKKVVRVSFEEAAAQHRPFVTNVLSRRAVIPTEAVETLSLESHTIVVERIYRYQDRTVARMIDSERPTKVLLDYA